MLFSVILTSAVDAYESNWYGIILLQTLYVSVFVAFSFEKSLIDFSELEIVGGFGFCQFGHLCASSLWVMQQLESSLITNASALNCHCFGNKAVGLLRPAHDMDLSTFLFATPWFVVMI